MNKVEKSQDKTKKCPKCQEEIKVGAVKCKHCKERLENSQNASNGKNKIKEKTIEEQDSEKKKTLKEKYISMKQKIKLTILKGTEIIGKAICHFLAFIFGVVGFSLFFNDGAVFGGSLMLLLGIMFIPQVYKKIKSFIDNKRLFRKSIRKWFIGFYVIILFFLFIVSGVVGTIEGNNNEIKENTSLSVDYSITGDVTDKSKINLNISQEYIDKIIINGESISFNSDKGIFTYEFKLKTGLNEIKIKGKNDYYSKKFKKEIKRVSKSNYKKYIEEKKKKKKLSNLLEWKKELRDLVEKEVQTGTISKQTDNGTKKELALVYDGKNIAYNKIENYIDNLREKIKKREERKRQLLKWRNDLRDLVDTKVHTGNIIKQTDEGERKKLALVHNDKKIAYENVEDYISKVRKRLKKEKRRNIIEGFKNIQLTRTPKILNLQFKFSNINLSNRYVYDHDGDRYRYSRSERGEKYITMDASITSSVKDPELPVIAFYKYDDLKLKRIGISRYRFSRWEGYGSYLGNHHDSSNDFKYSKSVSFSIGGTVLQDIINNNAVFVILLNKKCFYRSESRFSTPPVKYVYRSCSIPNTISLKKLSQFDVLRIFNKYLIK